MFARLLIFLCVALIASAPVVNGWGVQGHNITASLAQSLLNSNAKFLVRDLLNSSSPHSMAAISSWADQVRVTPYPFTNSWHTVATPNWFCNYSYTRDCPKTGCVDSAIKNYTSRLIDADNNLDYQQHSEALKFIIHFIGDLHQPMHASFKSVDTGAAIIGTFMNGSKGAYQGDLHNLWDTGLIDWNIDNNYHGSTGAWYKHLFYQLQQLNNSVIEKWNHCKNNNHSGDLNKEIFTPCQSDWINESADYVCHYAYERADGSHITKKSGFDLNISYFNHSFGVLEQRLLQAGVRMAHTINKIADIVVEVKKSKTLNKLVQRIRKKQQ